MKIEKISDNQIRCTLNKSDLVSRHLKISELAYGSEKAKELFRDMMQQAAYEFGFETDDIPLMIEAIPVSSDCIILIVTKVEDPEELDTRFSRFSPSDSDFDEFDYPDDEYLDTLSAVDDFNKTDTPPMTASDELDIPDKDAAGDIINLFSKVKDYLNKSISELSADTNITGNSNIINNASDNNTNADKQSASDNFVSIKDSINGTVASVSQDKSKTNSNPVFKIFSFDNFDTFIKAAHAVSCIYIKDSINGTVASVSQDKSKTNSNPVFKIFSFDNFDTFIKAAHAVSCIYSDKNSLFKCEKTSSYYLVLEKTSCKAIDFNKTCNILSEYG